MESKKLNTFFTDEQSFEIVFNDYYDLVANAIYRIIKDKAISEDIAQDVFIKIWSNKDVIVITSSIKSYLIRSAINAAINYRKKNKNKIHTDISEMLTLHQDLLTIHDIEYSELLAKYNKIIDKLPDRCKEIYFLSRYENLTNRQIGESLNISIKTVENQMTKTLKIFYKNLGDYFK